MLSSEMGRKCIKCYMYMYLFTPRFVFFIHILLDLYPSRLPFFPLNGN